MRGFSIKAQRADIIIVVQYFESYPNPAMGDIILGIGERYSIHNIL